MNTPSIAIVSGGPNVFNVVRDAVLFLFVAVSLQGVFSSKGFYRTPHRLAHALQHCACLQVLQTHVDAEEDLVLPQLASRVSGETGCSSLQDSRPQPKEMGLSTRVFAKMQLHVKFVKAQPSCTLIFNAIPDPAHLYSVRFQTLVFVLVDQPYIMDLMVSCVLLLLACRLMLLSWCCWESGLS